MRNMMGSKSFGTAGRIILLGVLIVFLFASMLWAQEMEEAQRGPAEFKSLFELINYGGVISWWIVFLGLLSMPIIIMNLINLVWAGKYWSAKGTHPIKDNGLLDKIVGFGKFLFWPKVLKGMAVLVLLSGFLGSFLGAIGAFTLIEQMQSPSPALLASGIYRSLVSSALGLFVALGLFFSYYLFRLILYIIAYLGQKKY